MTIPILLFLLFAAPVRAEIEDISPGTVGFPCRDPLAPRTVAVDVMSYGLGLSIMPHVEGGGVACTEPLRGRWMLEVNLDAGFASSGRYFGRSGVCGLFVVGPGYGAAAGLSLLAVD